MTHIKAGLLDVEYRDDGPADGLPVLLLHGWPDDASTWDEVAPILHRAGLRTIAPSLRGFAGTRFLARTTPRTGNAAMLAMDAVALMDALGIRQFVVAGHDWGSSTAEALALGWPQRVRRIAMLSSPPRLGGTPTPSFQQAYRYWYHWFQSTARGRGAVRDDPRGFARMMWDTWSPPGWYSSWEFARVARSFRNPDWADVTIHSYRARWDEAAPDPASLWLDQRIRGTKRLALPVLYIHGEADAVNPPATAEGIERKMAGPFGILALPGVGHFPTRESPKPVGKALVEHFTARFSR